jgi:hypothetical protein
MENKSDSTREQNLTRLLSSLHHSEPEYPDDFEDRFLAEFHARQSAPATQPSFFSSLKEKLSQFLSEGSAWKWAYSSMAVVTACIVAMIFLSDPNPEPGQSVFSGNQVLPELQPVSAEHTVSFEAISNDEPSDDDDLILKKRKKHSTDGQEVRTQQTPAPLQ